MKSLSEQDCQNMAWERFKLMTIFLFVTMVASIIEVGNMFVGVFGVIAIVYAWRFITIINKRDELYVERKAKESLEELDHE